jgi:hypothetical protein
MSWASSQNYPTAQSLFYDAPSATAVPINTTKLLFTAPPLPEGIWMCGVNNVTISSATNALSSTSLSLNQTVGGTTTTIAQVSIIDGDFVVFPTLSTVVKGGSAYSYTLTCNCNSATAGTTYNIAGVVNEIFFVRLTNTSA